MRRMLNKIASYVPTQIPTGMTKFNEWVDSIVELAGPIADRDSIRWVICNEIMRLAPGRDRIARNSMVKLLRKFAANQLAAAVVVEIRAAQDKKLEEANKQAEATAQQQAASNGLKETV